MPALLAGLPRACAPSQDLTVPALVAGLSRACAPSQDLLVPALVAGLSGACAPSPDLLVRPFSRGSAMPIPVAGLVRACAPSPLARAGARRGLGRQDGKQGFRTVGRGSVGGGGGRMRRGGQMQGDPTSVYSLVSHKLPDFTSCHSTLPETGQSKRAKCTNFLRSSLQNPVVFFANCYSLV